MKRHKFALCLVICFSSTQAIASSVFVGYEFGQMAFNGFKHVAGEVGVELESNASVRLTFLNVALSERHLSSSEASAVNGDNVEGLWRGAELHYDVPLTTHIFVSPSVGFYDSKYSHTVLDQTVRQKSTVAGVSLSYTNSGVFGFEELYWRFSFSYRHYFNPIGRTNLGDAVVRGDSAEFTPALFVGYRFK